MIDTPKVFIQTYGCQMNVHDSDRMLDTLKTHFNMEKTDHVEQADLILLNTCSIREKAQEKVFSELGRWRKLKDKKPDLLIGVGGCVASQEGKHIIDRAPYVDLIFGPQTIHRLPELINKAKATHKPALDISFPEIEKFDKLPTPSTHGPSAFVSIMEGCSKFCSFCIVPYTRGEEISRRFDDVLSEVMHLAEQGVCEVNLLGQNVNDYRGAMHEGGHADLALLIHYIAAIDGIKRIRFTTSHPAVFSQALIDAYAEEPKLANHLHLPVQSGSDRILNAMKRGYTTLEYKDKIRRLRKARPDISLSSDFIVGFPGETEEDFEKTLNLVKDLDFDHSFSFIYSPRPGTPAAELEDNTPLEVKKERLARLQAQLLKQEKVKSNAMLNTTQAVLITGKSKKNEQELTGRTENNRVVNFQGDEKWIGAIVPVVITDVYANSLRGRVTIKENETNPIA